MFPADPPADRRRKIRRRPRYWSWNGGPREGRGLEAMEKGGQIVGAGGAGGGWECLGKLMETGYPWLSQLPNGQ